MKQKVQFGTQPETKMRVDTCLKNTMIKKPQEK